MCPHPGIGSKTSKSSPKGHYEDYLLSSLQKLQGFCLIFIQKIMLQSKYSIGDLLINLPVT